jgi:hypothetical protein
MDYLWSDAWLLQPIIVASRERPATLAEVLAAADSVNHALPTSDELHGGLARLTSGGFVQELGNRFAATHEVVSTVLPEIKRSGWPEGRRAASDFLRAEEWTSATNVRDPRNNVRYPGLTDERIASAEREYRRQLRK